MESLKTKISASFKDNILQKLKEDAKQKINEAKSAYQTTSEHAKDQDLLSESKWDTRSIEAGYLAGAQEKRVKELEDELSLLESIDLNLSNQSVCVGSLVLLKLNNLEKLFFISSAQGGTMKEVNGHAVLVISAFSPIGRQAIGCEAGETFEVETKNEIREYEVLTIW